MVGGAIADIPAATGPLGEHDKVAPCTEISGVGIVVGYWLELAPGAALQHVDALSPAGSKRLRCNSRTPHVVCVSHTRNLK